LANTSITLLVSHLPLKEYTMPPWFENVAKPVAAIGGLLSALAVVVGLFAVIFDWKQIYAYLNIQHVKRALVVGNCSKTYSAIPNVSPFKVTFSNSDCDESANKMNVVAGSVSKSYICGGMDNFEVHLQPKGATFWNKARLCQPSERNYDNLLWHTKRLTNVRLAAHYGLNSDIELGPKSANRRHHRPGRI
jgi:hypothetical protein